MESTVRNNGLMVKIFLRNKYNIKISIIYEAIDFIAATRSLHSLQCSD